MSSCTCFPDRLRIFPEYARNRRYGNVGSLKRLSSLSGLAGLIGLLIAALIILVDPSEAFRNYAVLVIVFVGMPTVLILLVAWVVAGFRSNYDTTNASTPFEAPRLASPLR